MHAIRRSPESSELGRLSYAELDRNLRALGSDKLLKLFDSKSIKVGDTAAHLLAGRRETDQVIDAIVGNKLRTKLGKLRGLHVLQMFGAECVGAVHAYRHAATDRNADVADSALFGLVFLQDMASLPLIESLLANSELSSEKRASLRRARGALESRDPVSYSPYYSDPDNVWKIKKETMR